MAAITFAEIMNCYPDNPLVYKHIKQDHGKLIPFVGAGLSVPCYPLWPKALKELAEQVAVPETKSDILEMIEGKNLQLLEAAQALEDYWGKKGMADHLLELFSAAKIQEHKEKLPHQSVWLLSLLFPGKPAVTTNFDRVLETVYHMQGCQFDTVILPNRQELHDLLLQGERHGLLKLHGDIGSETLEYSSIIFGKQQYEAAYQQGQPIVRDLKGWFSNKMLLFLGCSLKADEYLNLLQEVVQLHPGVTHYAILECEDVRNAVARARQLRDQWGIQALFYPKGRHEAVRVILEKLLEDHDPIAYQALSTHVGALSNQSPSSRFHYKSGAVSFHGRRKELEHLRAFCGQEHVAFRWWAVTGAGGAGKSRLVYEFGREMEGFGWNVLWLNSAHMDNLEALPIPTKTLVVVDYAQAYLRPLGHWMEQLAQRPNLVPVRLLLLERDGASLDESSWGIALKSHVYRAKSIRESCWKEAFLQISPLQEKELLGIMTDYAYTAGKRLPETKAQQLLKTLKTTDPGLRRPLYAMFLTDAWANGEKPEKWGQKAVLDYVLQRENEYFEGKTKETIGNIPRVNKNLNKLRLVATIWDGITPEQVAQEYPKLWEAFQQQAERVDCAESEEDLLRQVGILQRTELAGLKPDLVGEHFVLQQLNEPEVLQLLFIDGWKLKDKIVAFLFRMYWDYHDTLENMGEFWENVLDSPTDSVIKYRMMCVNIAGLSNTFAESAVDMLEGIWEESENREIDALWYAMGLLNLSNQQGIEGRGSAIERLREVHELYPENEQIALEYAKTLVNLSNRQKLERRKATIEQVKKIQEQYSGDEEIAFAYATGLYNLLNRQVRNGKKAIVERLKKIQEQYPRNEKIAFVYATGLYSLSCDQSIEDVGETIGRLEELYGEYSGNGEIALLYAQGVFNLSCDQPVEEAEDSIERLKKLHERYSEHEEIALLYANGLYNLSCDYPVEKADTIIEQLKVLHERYSGNEKIALTYAQGLTNLSIKQTVEGRKDIIGQLKKLYKQYAGDEQIVVRYAKGLVNLSDGQTVEKIPETIRHLEDLYRTYSDNEEVTVAYALGLYNLAEKQTAQEAQVTISKLKELCKKYPENEKIKEVFTESEEILLI